MAINFLIAAAAAMTGAAIQNKRDKKAYIAAESKNEQRRGDYYVNLRNDAEKGGFNPLTALRSGGGMGYSNLAGRITQPLMTRSPLAAGISAGSNAYMSYSMTRMNQKQESQMQMQQFAHDERMANLNAKLAKVEAFNGSENNGLGTEDPIKVFGFEIEQEPNTTNVEVSEQRYGDVVSTLVGLGVLAADAYQTAKVLFTNEETAGFDANRRRQPNVRIGLPKLARSVVLKRSEQLAGKVLKKQRQQTDFYMGRGGYSNNPHYSGIFY